MKRFKVIYLIVMTVFLIGALSGCSTDKKNENISSIELTRLMGNGTNLGNTMEAYGHGTLGVGADTSSYETYWGQPVTTQEIITGMKESGFDSIRIPVAWTNAMDFENGDYTINEDYLNRVEEIINYALNEDMYVIINDHWDGGWWGMFGSANEETREKAMDMYISMWTQISEEYADYSNKLIFESANEELGNRLNDLDLCPDSGSLSEDECYEMTNKINQAFVDTVRSTGGNNKDRFLLIAGYNTDIKCTCDDRFIMPEDSADDKLLISVHYYEPFGYCGSESLSTWGTSKDYEDQNEFLEMMTKFTEQGYGVVIGEYSVALNKDKSVKENTCDFINNFLDNCDLYGYCPMFWDCSSHYIRTDLAFSDEAVAKTFKSRSLSEQSDMNEEDIIANAKSSIEESLVSAKAIEEENRLSDDESVAWIMFNSNDWNTIYSVGDEYNPTAKTGGVEAVDVEVTGEGTYTVSLDFTGTGEGFADSTVFCALAIANGEQLYPEYSIIIKEMVINGEVKTLKGKPYTTSDDGKCTRVNIYNEWVTSVPPEARTADGNTNYVTPILIDNTTLGRIETIEITFDYCPKK